MILLEVSISSKSKIYLYEIIIVFLFEDRETYFYYPVKKI